MTENNAAIVDGFGRRHDYLRLSLTDRCNLRCAYCMPSEGIALKDRSELLSFDEIERLAKIFASMGIRKIRVTGGEPLLRKNVCDLLSRLASIPGIDTLAMTTNGVALEQHASALKDVGISRLNISLDTLRPARFAELTRRHCFFSVRRGLDAALAQDFESVKINVVVMRGFNEDELEDFVDLAREHPIQVRFIEYMPFNGNPWKASELVSYADIVRRLSASYPLMRQFGDDSHAPARTFSIPGFQGHIGVIAAMTRSFCDQCNRLRLTAEGNLKSCLFHHPEGSLRDAMRSGLSDDALKEMIQGIVLEKPEGHPGMEQLPKQPNRSMVQIGG